MSSISRWLLLKPVLTDLLGETLHLVLVHRAPYSTHVDQMGSPGRLPVLGPSTAPVESRRTMYLWMEVTSEPTHTR